MELLKKIHFKDILGIIIGSFIVAIGMNFFIKTAGLLSGGVPGISLIINRVFNIPTGLMVAILNTPIFILSFLKLNKKLTVYSFVGMLTLSLSLIITEPMVDMLILNDKLLLGIYGGVLNGIGCGIIYLNYGTTGGMDIISIILRKKFPTLNITQISFGLNLVIVSVGAFLFGLTGALYTLISMYISTIVADKVVDGFHAAKSVFIITDKQEEITENIMTALDRGVTKIPAEGGYTNNEKTLLYCVVSLSQLPELKAIIREIDKKAFITITDTSEILGGGFKKPL